MKRPVYHETHAPVWLMPLVVFFLLGCITLGLSFYLTNVLPRYWP